MLYKIFIAFTKWLYISPLLFIINNITIILYNFKLISYNVKEIILFIFHVLAYIHIYNHFNFVQYLLMLN